MAIRSSKGVSTKPSAPIEASPLFRAGLDALSFGFAVFDKDLRLVASNKAFRTLRGYPAALCKPGTEIIELYRFNAARGDYGVGDVETHARSRVDRIRKRRPHELEYELASGRILNIRYTPISPDGLLLTYADITERKQAEQKVAEKEAQLRVAMDNMPGALVYTDEELNLVVCNRRFAEIYQIPSELLQPGRPYPDFLRYLAEHGYYGDGDVDALVAERVESLRNPTDKTFEDHTPDGRIHEVYRRHAEAGGTVTVITDITELKRAEQELADKEAQLHVALDNMPGALVYTDEELNIVACNERFAEMYPVPSELLQPGCPYPDFLRYLAEHGYYGDGDVDALVAKRVESLRNPSGKAFEDHTPDGRIYRIGRRRVTAGGTVTVMTDITELKRAEQELADKEAQLHVALDNMPGALVYTDEELNIVACNERFAEMYPVPSELLQPGCPYPDFLRYLAEHGYYGDGDVDALVAKRVESLRNPSGKAFEDHTPDGRIYRIGRRRVTAGGTVTVMTDITELKRTEQELREAKQRAESANELVTEKNQMLESLSSKLSKYLSPQLYNSIFSGEKDVKVASQRKKLTIFFSDIAGFTETTDLLESEELTSLLNQYLTEMSSIALEYGATIDKFVGDAIMLFFGDPETRGAKQDAIACVKMAIAMQQRMRDLQAEWRERGQEHVFQLRIGINTGYCTVGNFGSDDRVDYTIIGNEVNLAARLQPHADLGGVLLAHETYWLVKDVVLAEETGTITVKGFPRPVRTYRVVGLYDDTAIQGRIIRKEQEGLTLIIDRKKLTRKGQAEAIRALQEAVGQLKD
ncbi:MAG: PAS-domain containing protein [Kiloniellales bacterium]